MNVCNNIDPEHYWESRRTYMMVLLCQIIGTPVIIGMTNTAIVYGATGYILAYILTTIIFGIPLLYMEFIISQFTARDCIDVWKIYPCVSHIGYIQVFWQIIVIISNHFFNAFNLHYLLISFESPIPYYTCGHWAKDNCNILVSNYTINQDCIRQVDPPKYCGDLYTTFPEYQYWRYRMLGEDKDTFKIAWRVSLASFLICVITYLTCFKRKRSVKWVIEFFILYPILGYILLLMGSMLQKGVVEIYQESLDSDFGTFFRMFRLPTLITQIIFSLGIGSGTTFNLASSSPFRSPCYSNTVITVAVSAAVSTLAICTTAMMACPYAFTYGIDPDRVMKAQMTLLYEKTPRFIKEYRTKYFWLVLIFSCHAVLGIGTNLVYVLHLLEMLVARNPRVARYPGMATFFGIIMLYLITIPLLGKFGMYLLVGLRRCSSMLGVFFAVIETVVYVISYGVDRFSEDVHFMQGLQPNKYTRLSWLVSSVTLSYAFITEIIHNIIYDKSASDVGRYVFISTICLIVLIFLLKLLIAAIKGHFRDVFKLDATWGPKSEVLQRSRAMFTAQAMTKEYLYRQYHLQAGIVARQKMSNCRTVDREPDV
ncbi:hypothetical protein ABMA27_000398 [Loxostege sticticalis]|uniref:Uncharacterized protein n=1 Tax=Loxostege sticticalis TaxID=481309 RepID=A0ABR3INI4_LOXSC